MPRFVPYRSPAASSCIDTPASVHECGDIILRLDGPLGPTTVRLDPRTVDVRYEPRLRELSTPFFFAAFLFASCEAGGLMLLSRRLEGLPAGALRPLSVPLIVFVVAAVGLFDPAARRVFVRGASRSGERVTTSVAFTTARGAKRFVVAAQAAASRARADLRLRLS